MRQRGRSGDLFSPLYLFKKDHLFKVVCWGESFGRGSYFWFLTTSRSSKKRRAGRDKGNKGEVLIYRANAREREEEKASLMVCEGREGEGTSLSPLTQQSCMCKHGRRPVKGEDLMFWYCI